MAQTLEYIAVSGTENQTEQFINPQIAAAFNSNTTYSAGDFCVYEGVIYKCTSNNAISGAWDSSKWSIAYIADEIKNVKTEIDNIPPLDTTLSATDQPADAKAVGDAIGEVADDIADAHEKIDAVTDLPTNHFFIAPGTYTYNGVTITVANNGTLTLNGDSTATTYIPLLYSLPAGVWSAKCTYISGTQSSTAHPNLRYGTSEDGRESTSWVNNTTNKREDLGRVFDTAQRLFLSFGSSASFTDDFTVRFQVEAGTSVGAYSAPQVTAVDSTARTRLDTAESELDSIQDALDDAAAAAAVRYVAPDGDDNSDGHTASTPFATIAKAITDGASIIYLAAGDYTENVYTTYHNLKIIGYGATIHYDTTGSSRQCAIDLRYGYYEIYGVKVEIEDLTGTGSQYETSACGIKFHNSDGLLVDCTVDGAPQMGFWFYGAVTKAIRCIAKNCGVDGFNGHDFKIANAGSAANPDYKPNDGTFIDCIALDCGDDGLSYHENSIMHVLGGEYAGNGSTGIAPHGNCVCEIRSAYIHDNGRAGIEALVGNITAIPDKYGVKSASGIMPDPLPTMVLSDCIIADNNGNAVTAEHYIVKETNNGFSGNITDKIVQTYSNITSYSSRQLLDITELYQPNLFYFNDTALNQGNLTITVDNEGALTINGVSGSTTVYLLCPFISLQPNTYTATMATSGVGTNNAISLRCGNTINGTLSTRWVNTSNPRVVNTYLAETYIFLGISGGKNFDNYKVKIQIEEGDISGDYTTPSTTATDLVARKQSKSPYFILPQKTVAVVGKEYNLFFDNVINGMDFNQYGVKVSFNTALNTSSNAHCYEKCLRFTPTVNDIGENVILLTLYKKIDFQIVESKAIQLSIITDITNNMDTKHILFIGDSLTQDGRYITEIQYNLSNGKFISVGTLTTNATIGSTSYSAINHEGRSGWSAKNYTTKNSITSGGVTVTNAFWDAGTSSFNFNYYLTQNSSIPVPDIICIGLGTNGNVDSIDDVSAIIASIRANSSTANTPILVSLIPPPASQDGCGYSNSLQCAAELKEKFLQTNAAYIEKYENTSDSVYENLDIAELYFHLDREHDFSTTTIPYSARNTSGQMTIQSNNVHPNEYGYLHIADAWYNRILYYLTKDS